ncbi:hypothetical protein E4T47_07672 [Aureobasidium subglaciale]|nr:hypothetical protein E4T47_07672 [Aureobasidium subglaciale]
MALIMRNPFPSLSADNFIPQGSAGQIFAITASIYFKCPNLYVSSNLTRYEENEMEENIGNIEKEKAIYHLLNSHPHPNLLYAILCIPEGIFMPRLETCLAALLEQPSAVSPDRQELWIQQLASAAAWLEKLGLAHGDLRPENILVDRDGNLSVADFDATVAVGSEQRLATLPFTKVDEKFQTPPAGPDTEQFSIGSCIYNIRFGTAPFADAGLESPVWRKMLVCRQFPATEGDRYGAVIQDCWNGAFASIAALETEIARLTTVGLVQRTTSARRRLWYLRAQCYHVFSWEVVWLKDSNCDVVWLYGL